MAFTKGNWERMKFKPKDVKAIPLMRRIDYSNPYMYYTGLAKHRGLTVTSGVYLIHTHDFSYKKLCRSQNIEYNCYNIIRKIKDGTYKDKELCKLYYDNGGLLMFSLIEECAHDRDTVNQLYTNWKNAYGVGFNYNI